MSVRLVFSRPFHTPSPMRAYRCGYETEQIQLTGIRCKRPVLHLHKTQHIPGTSRFTRWGIAYCSFDGVATKWVGRFGN